MKNKRTKLTAILLSALMAVSTISSVTWAADLFSDGSDETDTVVEEPVDVVSDAEEESVADDTTLTLAGIEYNKVKFQYGKSGDVEAFFVTADGVNYPATVVKGGNLPTPAILSETCISPERAIYSAQLGSIVVLSSDNSGKVEISSDCQTYDSTSQVGKKVETGYIITKKLPAGKKFQDYHKALNNNKVTIKEIPSTCNADGYKIEYVSCDHCNALYIGTVNGLAFQFSGGAGIVNGVGDNTHGYFVDNNIVEKQGKGKSLKEYVTEIYENLVAAGQALPDSIIKTLIPMTNEHVYDESSQIITLTDKDFIFEYDIDGNGVIEPKETTDITKNSTKENYTLIVANGVATKYIANTYDTEDLGGMLQFAPLNCIGTQIADPDNGRDAYYYQVVKCKYCNTVKYYDKIVIKNVSDGVVGDFYEPADMGNIWGFFAKGVRNKVYLFAASPAEQTKLNALITKLGAANISIAKTNSGSLYWDRIPCEAVSDPPEVIFKEDNKFGYYYKRTYVKDTDEPVDETLLEASKVTHVWGTVEVAAKGTPFIDDTTSQTEDDKLLIAGSGLAQNAKSHLKDGVYVVVVRDSSGNVTEAKSKNCITTAKYQLYHKCLLCDKNEKVGDLKTAGPNTDIHNYGDWSTKPDPADDKYYQIENEKEHDDYHMKYSYLHQVCKDCGKRNLQLYAEEKEPHRLVKQKYDDNYDQDGKDSTLVPATCGKDGSYDVILRCACRFEDDSSRKSEKIPATDQHDFTGSELELKIVGSIQVGGRTDKYGKPIKGEEEDPNVRVIAQLVRKCTQCGEYDSNGINGTLPGKVGPEVFSEAEGSGRTFTDYKEAKINPETNLPYPCSVGQITVNFKWSGKVGTDPYIKEDSITVPYYTNSMTFAGRRDHEPDDVRVVEKVEPTTETPGYIVRDVYCSVCKDKVSTERTEIAPLGSAPSIKASSVNYNTINVSWDAVQDADYYILYYKSSDLGVTTWKRVRTVNGTSFVHSGLVTGAKYRYTVRAVLDGVKGEYDRKGSIAIPKLAAPESVAVTAVSGKNKVSWSKVDGANGYIIQRSTGSGWTRVGSVKKGAKVTWTDKKPVSGATYRVRAYRTVNDANFSKDNVYSAFSAAK